MGLGSGLGGSAPRLRVVQAWKEMVCAWAERIPGPLPACLPARLPAAFLRTVLAFMRPFVSKKAGRKIKQVQSVHEIAEATGGEVTVQSLGPAFVAEQLEAEAAEGGAAGDASP